ncbi:MAG: four helix bundle suffix domain-containing protein [Kiritimatiellae bacterium]|nr:four helix bundle suffix domain-containing protein [Kiritimatiellia bacterium]
MADVPKIVLPHGGYKKLLVYRKSDVVYEGTVVFCRRFLPPRGDRTVDQMVQAARSCKQNIAEGSSASGTSKETEIKLTNVARATLDELMEDYLDYLKRNNLAEWSADDQRASFARDYAKKHNDWSDWREIFETRPAETLANLMLTICNQTSYMLGRMIERQEADFKKFGGVRERMHAARTAARAEDFSRGIYSRLAGAATSEELEKTADLIRNEIDRISASIARKRGWR